MSIETVRLIFVVVELICVLGVLWYCLHLTALLLSRWYDIPFVPTDNKTLNNLLHQLQLPKGLHFLDLGCGDGRVIAYLVRAYHGTGVGVERNPVMALFARIRILLMGLRSSVSIVSGSMFDYAWSRADVIYIFGMPSFLEREECKYKFLHEAKKEAIIISHWYPIPYLTDWKETYIENDSHRTYIYQPAQT